MENNNQDIKLCPSCGFKNRSVYKYCNECGAPLNQSYYTGTKASENSNVPTNEDTATHYSGRFNQAGYTPNAPYETNLSAPYFGTSDFNGISAKDVFEFTGEKADLFYKIKVQHFSNRYGPYCWPLFVLGIVFGFVGMGCWYLYHKMYKPAIGFFIAEVTNIILTCSIIFSALDDITVGQLGSVLKSPDKAYEIFLKSVDVQSGFAYYILSVMSVVAVVLAIILPCFAYKQYKNHMLHKICEQYASTPIPNISAAGGTKGGLVAIACLAYVIVFFAAVSLAVVPFTDKFFKASKIGVREERPEYYNHSYNDKNYGNRLPSDQYPFDEPPFGGGNFGYNEEPHYDKAPGEYW